MTYLWHVALGVGMGTRETREHLTDADVALYQLHIAEALALPGGGGGVPGHPGYAMAAHNIAGILLCTVGRVGDQIALCTFCVATRSNHAAKAWRALHDGYSEFAPSLGDVPRVPFCAVRGEFGLAVDPAAGAWLDAYQVAVAWAWIEGRRRDA